VEQQGALDLITALDESQQELAVVAGKARRDIRAAGETQPPTTEPEGIVWSDLTDSQQALLRKLIAEYASVMPAKIAQERMSQLREAGWENVHFAWEGAMQKGRPHYYKIQGPTFLIEYANTQPDPEGNIANHSHTVWHDMAGDFGISIAAGS
jgi:hypothetical protein